MTMGPAAAVLGGYKGASVKVLSRLSGEGSEMNPTWHSNALCAFDAVRACTCPLHNGMLVPRWLLFL